MRTLFQTIKQQFLEENDLVLVSVTASSGSTPRGAGSRMLVGKSGRISGTIGGGAVEYRAECMALDILEKKESCQHEFRLNHKDVENIGDYRVLTFKDVEKDYIKDMITGAEGNTGLPKSNVLYYQLENNAWCCVRPSGTEPKIKLYFGVKGKDEEDATNSLENLKDAMVKLVRGN